MAVSSYQQMFANGDPNFYGSQGGAAAQQQAQGDAYQPLPFQNAWNNLSGVPGYNAQSGQGGSDPMNGFYATAPSGYTNVPFGSGMSTIPTGNTFMNQWLQGIMGQSRSSLANQGLGSLQALQQEAQNQANQYGGMSGLGAPGVSNINQWLSQNYGNPQSNTNQTIDPNAQDFINKAKSIIAMQGALSNAGLNPNFTNTNNRTFNPFNTKTFSQAFTNNPNATGTMNPGRGVLAGNVYSGPGTGQNMNSGGRNFSTEPPQTSNVYSGQGTGQGSQQGVIPNRTPNGTPISRTPLGYTQYNGSNNNSIVSQALLSALTGGGLGGTISNQASILPFLSILAGLGNQNNNSTPTNVTTGPRLTGGPLRGNFS